MSERHYDLEDDDDEPESLKHSGLGIASFILSLVSGVFSVGSVVVAGVLTMRAGGMNETSPEAMLVGCCIIAFMFLALVALGLGVAGLMQADRKKVFAILGCVGSIMTIVGIIGLMILGMMAK